jgi:hypothetical protein
MILGFSEFVDGLYNKIDISKNKIEEAGNWATFTPEPHRNYTFMVVKEHGRPFNRSIPFEQISLMHIYGRPFNHYTGEVISVTSMGVEEHGRPFYR